MRSGIDFGQVRRVVVKVGTSTITTSSGRIDHDQLKSLVDQFAWLVESGRQVVVVTSAAIAAGVEALGLKERPASIPELQAAASVGQGLLLHEYARRFAEKGTKVGQVLLTQLDVTHREQYLNARNALQTLLELGAVPIVNENDATGVDEIKFGDNDLLAALVANIVEANLLVLLTDIDGLFSCDPRLGDDACLLEVVDEITPEIEELAGGAGSRFGSGGMFTKVQAAKVVTYGGTGMVIANGRRPAIIKEIFEGEKAGTLFLPSKKRIDSRRLWIAFGKIAAGTIAVDEGAKNALMNRGKSLLPAGITDVKGDFSVGDAVDIADQAGDVFAKGLTNYSREEVERIKGLRSDEVSSKLPEAESEEVIHRDCLVILR
ncbi:MAG: glutamate 5-kinase [Actinobacteria bacterium]|nr:glutamate 5-kinase [Actinomycetota bacterium]